MTVRIRVTCECPHASEVHTEEVDSDEWNALSEADREVWMLELGQTVMGNFAAYGVSVLDEEGEEK